MPKYYCEYCDIYLTHSSPGGRRQHNAGRKHINNKIDYFMSLIRDPNFSPPAYIVEMGGGVSIGGMSAMLGRPGVFNSGNPAIPTIIRPPPMAQTPWAAAAAANPFMMMMGRGGGNAAAPPTAGTMMGAGDAGTAMPPGQPAIIPPMAAAAAVGRGMGGPGSISFALPNVASFQRA